MKLKQWLREYKQMSYREYRELSEFEQYEVQAEHQEFCRYQQRRASENWRPMTEDEIAELTETLEKEKQRYETSIKIGGIDEIGNYTALHYRWE